jgi:hypothetical protein
LVGLEALPVSFIEERRLPTRAELAERPHGTRLRYIGGCHCVPCRAANSRYETVRLAARKRGETQAIIDARPARRHMLRLSKKGVGYRAVAEAAGIARTVAADIRTGKKSRCRAGTVRKILAVTEDAVSDHALIDAGPTRARLEQLLLEGFTKAQLARRFGMATPALQFPLGPKITAKNASKVERFCRAYLMED